MKYTTITILSLFVYTYAHANQPTHHAYANAISSHNISTVQHNITKNTFNGFNLQNYNTFKKSPIINTKKPHELYGHAPMYGSELIYGEFNDDGTMGRSGGDTPLTTLSNIWLNWQHTDNKSKFNNHSPIKNKNDLVIAGLGGKQTKIANTTHNWGIHTGYIHSDQYNKNIHIDSQGGFLGLFNGFYYKNFNIKTNLTAGIFDNSARSIFGTDNFNDFWLSGALNTSYDIILDNTFILRPILNAEYTWITSENYTSASNNKINTDNFNIFELSPELQAIKHIDNGWYGKINIMYVMTFANNGNITIDNSGITNLNNTKYFEYGISVGKNIYQTNIYATIGRQDGNQYGWFGNINIKHLF